MSEETLRTWKGLNGNYFELFVNNYPAKDNSLFLFDKQANYEEWTSGRLSAGRRRVLATHWYGEGYERACQKYDFVKHFESCGSALTANGEGDEKIKLQVAAWQEGRESVSSRVGRSRRQKHKTTVVTHPSSTSVCRNNNTERPGAWCLVPSLPSPALAALAGPFFR